MDARQAQQLLQNLHLRKEFYIICIVAIILLIIFNYKIVPAITRPGSTTQRWLSVTGNFLLAFFAVAIAVGSVLFWLIGTNNRG